MNSAFGRGGFRDPQPGISLVVALRTQEGFRDPSLLDHAALSMIASWPPRFRVFGLIRIGASTPRQLLRLFRHPLKSRLWGLRFGCRGLGFLNSGRWRPRTTPLLRFGHGNFYRWLCRQW